jgi:hypothetical protein
MTAIIRPERPSRQSGEPWTAYTLAAELMWLRHCDDWWVQLLQQRVVALEEALVDRRAWRRLRRGIRRPAAAYNWVGRDFYGRRLEDVSEQWLERVQ